MDVKILSILQKKKKKKLFSILHTHFYKTLTSVCLFYHLFYLKKYFPHFFLLFIISPFLTLLKLSLSSFTLPGNSPLPPPLLVEIASPSLPHCHKQRSTRITITNPQFRIHKQRSTSIDPRSTSTILVDLSTNPQPQVHKNAFSISVDVSMCGCVRFLVDFVVCPFCGGGGKRC